jgi:hypothetical protein
LSNYFYHDSEGGNDHHKIDEEQT